ncbi:tetratricopeptide repeat protein [Candidatus Dojkabacteria bacterium]|nr:tetratricopeptide repeat protein [Candidatus Dojkabacteria bacterium]
MKIKKGSSYNKLSQKKRIKEKFSQDNSKSSEIKSIKFRIPKDWRTLVNQICSASIYIVIAIQVILTPFLFSNSYQSTFGFPKFILFLSTTTTITALFLIKESISDKKRFSQNIILSALVFFVITYILSTFLSPSPITSITGSHDVPLLSLISISCFALTVLILSNVKYQIPRQRILVSFVTIIVIILSLIVLTAQFLSESSGFSKNDIVKATFESPRELSMFLSICLPIVFIQIIMARNTMTRIISILSFVLGSISIVLTAQIVSWIWVIIAIGGIFAYLSIKQKMKLNTELIVIIITLLLSVGLLSLKPVNKDLNPYLTREFITNEISTHFVLDDQNLRSIKNNFLFGRGPETYRILNTNDQIENKEEYISLFSEVSSTLGIVGLIAFSLFIYSFFKTFFKNINQLNFAALGIGVSISIFFIQSLTHLPNIATISITSVLIGIFCSITSNNSRFPETRKKHSEIFVALIIFAMACSFFTIIEYAKAERLYQKSLTQENSTSIELINKAIDANPYNPKYQIQKAFLLTEYLEQDPSRSNSNNIVNQIRDSYLMAIALNQNNPESEISAATINYKLAMLYPSLEKDYLSQSVSYATEAIKIDGNNIDYQNLLGELYIAQEEYTKAIEILNKVIEQDDEHWIAYYNLAYANYFNNNYENALKYFKKVYDECPYQYLKDESQIMIDSIE